MINANPLLSPTLIIKDPHDVVRRLKVLGLTPALVRGTAETWARAQAVESKFEPLNAPGLKGWIAGTGFYRENLSLEGWAHLNPKGAPISLNKATGISISATSATAVTGLDMGTLQPTTKNTKGAATIATVLRNAAQLDFYSQLGLEKPKRKINLAAQKDRILTWLMLVFVDLKTETTRVEVSLPATINGGRVRHWVERILVSTEHGNTQTPKKLDQDFDLDGEAVDVPVQRKA